MFRLFLLLSMVVVSIGISFADFQSEWKACGGSSSISSCYEKVNKKYIVSKTSACNLQNDIVTNKPIQTLRAKEKTLTTSFYKYNSKLFYQVAVSKDQKLTADKVTSYMYMYDCKKKKSYDLSTNLPKSFLHIGDVISADGEVLRFGQSVQFNKGKIFFEKDLGGLAGKGYFFFDIVKSLFNEIEVEKFTNYNKRFNIVDKVAPNFQSDVNLMVIDSVNKDFIGSLYYLFPSSDLKGKIGLSKINLLTQTIEL